MQSRRSGNSDVSGYGQSTRWLSSILAVIATFLAVPVVYGLSVDFITGYATENYVSGIEGLIAFIWGCGLTVTIFFLCRAVFSTLMEHCRLSSIKRLF